MSDRINELISVIREKASLLQSQLATERSLSEKLHGEIESMKNEMILKTNEITALQSKLTDLENNMNTTEGQNVIGSGERTVSDEQIDELVKEIEYCIAQLKK